MKSLWRTAWALERSSPAVLPVVSAVPLPATRRGRKAGSSRARDGDYPRGVGEPSYLTIQSLRSTLESQVSDGSSSHNGRSRGFETHPKARDNSRYWKFKKLVSARFDAMVKDFHSGDMKSIGIRSRDELANEATLFRSVIEKAFDLAGRGGRIDRNRNPYFWSWRNAFINYDTSGLSTELKYSFTSFVLRKHLSDDAIACHERLADFRNPNEWFPATRTMQRKIYLHVGPTNSGKTYNALKALQEAKTGVYAGPLRLLAHEVFTRFKAKGKRCALITGEEQRIPEGDESYFASCTVEMTPLNQRVDVAVIDEIQMIGDEFRGWAWTQALLGVQAREVHLCGEERTVELIQAICAKLGDEVEVHRYKRLNGLQAMDESLKGRFENLRKGDAVVSFSRVNLHSIKAGIEKVTGKKCAIVYGALPPESRAQQAALFNDPDNDYDFLAASDAIGMGLNLEIRRVVFEAVAKHDGKQVRTLTLPELKQIGGRAGRYRTAAQAARDSAAALASPVSGTDQALVPQNPGVPAPNVEQPGLVTTMEDEDLEVVRGSFNSEAEPLKTAGLFPPTFVIERFASYFPAGTPFAFILLRLKDIAKISGNYHMSDMKDNIEIANQIQSYPMTIYDRCIFLTAPISLKDPGMREFLRALAHRVAYNETSKLLDIKEINLEILDYSHETYPGGSPVFLRNLEVLHKCLTLYLWLSYRYVGIFQDQSLAFHIKSLVEEKIDAYLGKLNYSPEARKERLKQLRKAAKKRRNKQKVVRDDNDAEPGQEQETVGNWTAEGHPEPLLSDLGEMGKIAPVQEVTP